MSSSEAVGCWCWKFEWGVHIKKPIVVHMYHRLTLKFANLALNHRPLTNISTTGHQHTDTHRKWALMWC